MLILSRYRYKSRETEGKEEDEQGGGGWLLYDRMELNDFRGLQCNFSNTQGRRKFLTYTEDDDTQFQRETLLQSQLYVQNAHLIDTTQLFHP